MPSPYDGLPQTKWPKKTDALLKKHPLQRQEIVKVVLRAWRLIFESSIGCYRIGEHIFPKPQVMGFFLHELIGLEFASRYPGVWRGESDTSDKDLVYIPKNAMSVEVKTSSHRTQIFGNRSYAQGETDPKKTKSGYYIAINFQGFTKSRKPPPEVVRIRFGWLDHGDWIGQKSATGQQARLKPEAEKWKLRTLYEKGDTVEPGEDVFDVSPGGDPDNVAG